MTTTTIGIEVTANAGAAVRAMQDLEAATLGTIVAADNAGESQKSLAQQTADAREKQLAATEAVQRAQRALAEHSATVAAHGRDSKEAAESLARLKAAQAEAAKQAAIAEKAVAGVAAETAKAVRESDKLTPALARVTREIKQTGTQAERSASDVRKLELAIVAAEKGSRGWGAAMSSFAGTLGAGAVGFALDKFKDGVEWAAEHNAEFGGTFERLKDTATAAGEALLNGPIGKGLTFIVGKAADAVAWFADLGESIGVFEREVKDTEGALIAYAKANEGAFGPLAEMARQTLLTAEAQERLNDAVRVGQRVREEEARKAFVLAGIAERDRREREARQRMVRTRTERDERVTADLAGRKPAEDLSASPTSRAIDFGAGEGASTQLAFEAEVAAYEREKQIREARLADIDREIEAMEARGEATTDLIDQRLAAEERLARWQEENAITHAEREAAITRREQVEHQKRLAGLRQAAAEEEQLLAEREENVAAVTEAVSEYGDVLVTGLVRAVEGEKGALASMLAEMLKATATKHAVLALAEAALAVGSAAGFNFGGAALHGQAAAMHAGVAVAAGVGAYVAGEVASYQTSSAAQSRPHTSSTAGLGVTRGGGGGSSGGLDEGLEAQEIPVSHEQLRRADPSTRAGGGHTVILQGGTFVGAGGMTQVVDFIEKELDRRARRGARPKN